MTSFDEPNRISKIFTDSGQVRSFDEADRLLQSFAIEVRVGDVQDSSQQILLYTLVNTAQRCFRGGVFVSGELQTQNLVPAFKDANVDAVCRRLGAICDRDAPHDSPVVVVNDPTVAHGDLNFWPRFGHWWGGVFREPAAESVTNGGALGAVIAAGLTVSGLFTFFVRDRAPHSVRSQYLCLWTDKADFGEPTGDGPELAFLPNDLWLLGLGHLGQAYAWLLTMLPYPNGHRGRALIQDDQRLGPENLATSALFFGEGEPLKTDAVKPWLESSGFHVRRIENRIGRCFRRETTDPAIALVGFDRPAPRRWAADAGFDLLVDGGIGATARSFSRIRVVTVPGPAAAKNLWPDIEGDGGIPTVPAYEALRESGVDRCGVTQVAGRAVAAPFVGLVTACAVLAQLLRYLHGQPVLHTWSFDVQSPMSLRSVANTDATTNAAAVPFCEAQEITSTSFKVAS